MKSPKQLSDKLARQWQNADIREKRLLELEWPIELTISKPTATQLKQDIKEVRTHLEQWRNVTVGKVVWDKINYRDTLEAIEIPIVWRLDKPSEWIAACENQSINKEFQKLSHIVGSIDSLFHSLIIRQRHLTADKTESEIVQACDLALQLQQNCAEGIPLRAFSLAGIDSKFFERHRRLMIKLLDVRFDGLVSEIGLESFLGALNENDHWLLIADLDGSLLPFNQIKVRDNELKTIPLNATNIIIIENEQCLHQLPEIKNTIAILGAGLNLSWMGAPWLNERRIAYWGDIDTWGLSMLAQARRFQPSLTPLLMTAEVYRQHSSDKAVPEPKTAGDTPPPSLTREEGRLYEYLLSNEKGRLEQEFLPVHLVKKALLHWATQ